jgi:predicted ArsR family transcriptional regulator
MPTLTRQRIIVFLGKHPSSNAAEISRGLSLTKESIQYHLKQLHTDGLVEIDNSDKQKAVARGRPKIYYMLSSHVYPTNVNHLVSCLLEQLVTRGNAKNDLQQEMSELARLMFKPIKAPNLTQVLNLTIKELNEHHYMASWEARFHGPRIIFQNCPYAKLVKSHPELCDLDCYIIENLIGRSIKQVVKSPLEENVVTLCVFEI